MDTKIKQNPLIEAELAVIGGMVSNQDCMNTGLENLTEADFEDIELCIIFGAIRELSSKKVFDSVEVANKASELHPDKNRAIFVKVAEAAELAAYPKTIKAHIDRLKNRSLRKRITRACHSILSHSNDDAIETEELLEKTNKSIGEIVDKYEGVEEYDHQQSVYQFTTSLMDINGKGRLKGYSSNIPKLDEAISGWQKSKMYIIGGLKKTGKSRFCLDLISRWLVDGLGGIMFSMEMGEAQIHSCIYGNRLSINTAKMGTNSISAKEAEKIMAECNRYSKQNFYISRKSAITPAYLRQTIAARKRKGPIDFIVIDYIQRMTSPGSKGRTEEVEQCALAIADIARDENVVMVCLSQLAGDAERTDSHKPIYSQVKNSQTIIEAADVVIILQDPSRGKPDEFACKDSKELKAMILQRDGESDIIVPILAHLQYSRFNELIQRSDPNE